MLQIKFLRIIFVLFFCGWHSSQAGLPIAKEYQIKSVFLYNFSHFVTWPKTAFRSDDAPFNFCILGEDLFKRGIDLAVKNENVNGHISLVQRLNNYENTKICHILFISKSEEADLPTILNYLDKQPVLTVSDIDSFVEQGGMIQFFVRAEKVRLFINPAKVKETGLRISGNLLRIAKIFRSF
jgi:hypothetical protein